MGYDEYNEPDSLDEASSSVREAAKTIQDVKSFANQAQKFAKRMNDNGNASAQKQPNASSSNQASSGASQPTTSNAGSTGANTSAVGANASTTGASTGVASSTGTGTVGATTTTAGTAGVATTAGTATVAGSVTMGIGAIVVVAATALKKGVDVAKKDEAEIMGETEESSEGGGFTALLFAIPIIIIVLAAIITAPALVLLNLATNPIGTISSMAESYFAEEKKEAFFNDLFGEDYDVLITSPREMNEETIEVYKEIVDYAIVQAFDTYVWNLLTDLNTWKNFMFDGYNPYATYQKFLDNPYPYTLTKEGNGEPYTIREFLANPDAIENNDLNYAEIFTILCQNPQFSFTNFSYSDFYDVMVSKKTTELLFEMEIGDIHYYKYESGESQSDIKDGVTSDGNKSLANTPSLNSTQGRSEYNETQMEQHIKNAEIATNPDYYEYVGTKTTYEYNYVAPSIIYKLKTGGDYKPGRSGMIYVGSGNGTHTLVEKHFGSYNADGTFVGENTGDYNRVETGKVPAGDYIKDGDTFKYVGNNSGDYTQKASAQEETKTNWWATICNAWDAFWNQQVEIAENVMDKILSWGKHFFFVYDVTVKPYGLEEMYAIANVSYDGYNYNNNSMKNYELLDYQEMWLRDLLPNSNLGPSYSEKRSIRSTVYFDIQNCLQKEGTGTYIQPTGRSLMNYLDNSLVNITINGNNYYQEWNTGERIEYEINYNPNGETVILDMYSYINQGDYPNDKRGPLTSVSDNRDSIKKSGCIDCSYIMLYEYYFRNELNVPFISLNYVKDKLFQTSDFMQDYNLTYGSTGSGNTSFSEDLIVQQITEGKPIILYLEGRWVYNGKCYHGSPNGHFLLIVGYDETGFYVYDPGSRSNTQSGSIPYEAFNYLSIKYLRTVDPNPEAAYSITYKINTISGIGGETTGEQ